MITLNGIEINGIEPVVLSPAQAGEILDTHFPEWKAQAPTTAGPIWDTLDYVRNLAAALPEFRRDSVLDALWAETGTVPQAHSMRCEEQRPEGCNLLDNACYSHTEFDLYVAWRRVIES